MWRSSRFSKEVSVICIACGASVSRSEAREYDKLGDRWDRTGKQFEYLCKPCHRDLSHQPRTDLEPLLVELGAGTRSQRSFLNEYCSTVRERYGSTGSRR